MTDDKAQAAAARMRRTRQRRRAGRLLVHIEIAPDMLDSLRAAGWLGEDRKPDVVAAAVLAAVAAACERASDLLRASPPSFADELAAAIRRRAVVTME